MAGTVYSKFFWSDWANDPQLMVCSMAAQGLWMRLLCIAAEASTPGHVLIAGRKPTDAELVMVTRVRADQLQPLIDELIRNRVCDVSRDRVLISRRLVRDFRRRQISSEGGKARQKQITETKDETVAGSSLSVQPICTATINQSPESINQVPSDRHVPTLTLEEQWGRIARLSEALGIDLTKLRNGHKFVEQLIEQEDAGFDFEQDMLPACAEARAAGKVPADLSSLKYFRQRFEAKRAQRKVGAIASVPAAAPDLSRDEWIKALRAFILVGAWVRSEWGPSPLEHGCKAPEELLAEAEIAWVKSGNHPRSAFHGNSMIAWSPEVSDFKTPAPFAARAA
jgi:hypothetical protein